MGVRLTVRGHVDTEEFTTDHDLMGAYIVDSWEEKGNTKMVIEGLDDDAEFADYMRGFGYKARVVRDQGNPRIISRPRRKNPRRTKSVTKGLLPLVVVGGLVWLLLRNK